MLSIAFSMGIAPFSNAAFSEARSVFSVSPYFDASPCLAVIASRWCIQK
jgi:hypothetical protein